MSKDSVLNTSPADNAPPKYKKELRDAITDNINATKNSVMLKELYIISNIMWRCGDDDACKTLTEEELRISSIIRSILLCKDIKMLINIKSFINGCLVKTKKKGSRSKGA